MDTPESVRLRRLCDALTIIIQDLEAGVTRYSKAREYGIVNLLVRIRNRLTEAKTYAEIEHDRA